MSPDGSDLRQLTFNDVWDGEPSWSPDGSKVVFTRVVDGHMELFVMAADGSDEQQITFGGSDSSSPSWSPDGSQIAFWRSGAWVVDVEQVENLKPPLDEPGGLERRLGDATAAGAPVWVGDGEAVAFVADCPECDEFRNDLVLFDLESGESETLVSSDRRLQDLAVSADGRRLAFLELDPTVDRAPRAVTELDLVTASTRPITSDAGSVRDLSWSPDGAVLLLSNLDCARSSTGNPVCALDAETGLATYAAAPTEGDPERGLAPVWSQGLDLTDPHWSASAVSTPRYSC